MKFGMHNRLNRGSQIRLFEFFYELRRLHTADTPVSEFRYCLPSASLSVLEEWEKRIVEYAMPSWYEFDQLSDSLCSFFTDINSVFTFLFVKYYRDEGNPSGLRCLAIVSYHPLFEVFPELLHCLSHLLVHRDTRNPAIVKDVLAKLAAFDQFRPSATLTDLTGVGFQHAVLRRVEQPDDQLPGLTQCSPLMELFNKVSSPDTLLFLLASMLLEKKLLLVGKRIRQTSLSVIGCVSLLYPMSWEHVLVPTLSASNIDHIGCLVPYIFGLAQPLYLANQKQVDANFADPDFVRVDLETADIYMAAGADEAEQPGLPSALVKRAKKSLKRMQLPAGGKQQPALSDSHFSQTFLRINAELLAPLRALAIRGATFESEQYLRLSPDGYHDFLRRFFGSQMFSEFADRYLSNPQDSKYQLFNRAADEALLRRKKLLGHNYRALKNSLLAATGEGAKRLAAGSAVAVRSFARHLPYGGSGGGGSGSSAPRANTLFMISGVQPQQQQQQQQQQQKEQQQEQKSFLKPPSLLKPSTSTDSVDSSQKDNQSVLIRARPVTMSGLRNATVLEDQFRLTGADSTSQLSSTIGPHQAPKRPPPPRPPPPSIVGWQRGGVKPSNGKDDDRQERDSLNDNDQDDDDYSSSADGEDDVSTDSSHELRISLHLVPTARLYGSDVLTESQRSNYSTMGATVDSCHAAANRNTVSLASPTRLRANGPPPLPPLSSLPDEVPSSPVPRVPKPSDWVS